MLNGRVQFGPISVLRSFMDRRVKPGDDESFRSRDAATHPSFAYAKKKQRKAKPKSIPKNRDQENSSPQKEGRRSADKRIHQEPHRNEMQRASFLLPLMLRGPRPPGPHGAGALAFRRPTAASEVF
jgi:hypothetical protein